MTEQSGNMCKKIFAVLANDASRHIFAQIELRGLSDIDAAQLSKKNRNALKRLMESGLIVLCNRQYLIGVDNIRNLLRADSNTSSHEGIQRFLKDGRIESLPRKPAQKKQLLEWVAYQVVGPDEILDEKTINERLLKFHPDFAMLRRYMIDERILRRSTDGGRYMI